MKNVEGKSSPFYLKTSTFHKLFSTSEMLENLTIVCGYATRYLFLMVEEIIE